MAQCEAALMGRTTFEPALSNEWWPRSALDVFVTGRPGGIAALDEGWSPASQRGDMA